jgi:hypothetical protein
MYAQLVQGGTTPDKRGEMDRIVTDDLIPALQEEPGFAGALNLVDRESGNAMMIILWETAEQAERPLSDYGPQFLQALAKITAITTGNREPMSIWEVNAKV